MIKHWAIDASPLILLGKADQLHWLTKLGEVVIPHAVHQEIEAGEESDPARQFLNQNEGRALVHADPKVSDELKAWDLGSGETSVVAWAIEHPEYEAVLDDAAARNCASVFGVYRRGTLSLVALAKRRGLIPACRPVFDRLRGAGLFVTPALIEQVAEAASE